MERQKVIRSAAPAYPARVELTAATARRMALAAALAAPLAACSTIQHVDGLMEDPNESWAMNLPSEGTRTVTLSTEDVDVVYRLELAVHDPIMDCLTTQEETVLTEVDAVLVEEPSATFRPDSDLGELEAALAATMAAFCGVGAEAIEETTLVVEAIAMPEDTGG
ncbi:MAG: hypothetical protein ABIO70_36835 [Pseudomonadota bacterium]